MKNGSYKVFNSQIFKLDTKLFNEKLEVVFNKLDSAAKFDIALGFILQIIETGVCQFFYTHANDTFYRAKRND